MRRLLVMHNGLPLRGDPEENLEEKAMKCDLCRDRESAGLRGGLPQPGPGV